MEPVEWIQKFFYVPELRGPLILMDYHQKVIREALYRDPITERFNYSTIVWSDIKKSIKSTIAAAVALYTAYHTEWGQIILVANDLDQADSRVGFYIRRAIELHPRMKEECRIRGYSILLPNKAQILSVPIDPSGEAGSNADMVVFSELWGAHQDAQRRMWTEMTLPPAKFGKSFRWIETYAGYSGESLLLEQLYDNGVRQGKRIWDDLELYRNNRMLVLWNTTPRCPWQSSEYYESEASILDPSEFSRIHQNQWISPHEAFIPAVWWDAIRENLPPLGEREPMVIALDAATTGDSFGLVGVTRHPQRFGDPSIRIVKKWTPVGGKINFLGTTEDPGPELFVRDLCKKFNVVQVSFDPYQLYDMSERLKRDGVSWCEPFNQGGDRLTADKQFYDVVVQKRLSHDGNQDLREHVLNADREADTSSRKLRIVKRSALLKVDLAVAASMAIHRCLDLNL